MRVYSVFYNLCYIVTVRLYCSLLCSGCISQFTFWLTFSTFKKNCPAEIRLHASLDGQHLVVKSVNSNHNHDVSKVNVYMILYQAMNVYEIYVNFRCCLIIYRSKDDWIIYNEKKSLQC